MTIRKTIRKLLDFIIDKLVQNIIDILVVLCCKYHIKAFISQNWHYEDCEKDKIGLIFTRRPLESILRV